MEISHPEQYGLTVEQLMADAVRKVKLSDWGDESFKRPLEKLLESFITEDNPNSVRLLFFRNECVRLLSNRLLVRNDFSSHPEIATVSLIRPLFIIGLGRTGSTLLHNLLSQDPSSRALLFWEMIKPSPPPDLHARDTDARIKFAKQQIENIYRNLPNLLRIHAMKAESPEECGFLLRHSFLTFNFYDSWRVPSYVKWLSNQDLRPAFRYYREMLQLLSWRVPGEHLVLKDPSHLSSLEAIMEVFPDAKFVWIHRDLLKSIPSFLSNTKAIHGEISPRETGEGLEYIKFQIEQGMKARDSQNEEQFLDIYYPDLIKDPVKTVYKIYDNFGYHFDPALELRINNWLKENKQYKYGVHRYDLEEFGLKSAYLKEQFKTYYERFEIREEGINSP